MLRAMASQRLKWSDSIEQNITTFNSSLVINENDRVLTHINSTSQMRVILEMAKIMRI